MTEKEGGKKEDEAERGANEGKEGKEGRLRAFLKRQGMQKQKPLTAIISLKP